VAEPERERPPLSFANVLKTVKAVVTNRQSRWTAPPSYDDPRKPKLTRTKTGSWKAKPAPDWFQEEMAQASGPQEPEASAGAVEGICELDDEAQRQADNDAIAVAAAERLMERWAEEEQNLRYGS
jgi:hypothetical protein